MIDHSPLISEYSPKDLSFQLNNPLNFLKIQGLHPARIINFCRKWQGRSKRGLIIGKGPAGTARRPFSIWVELGGFDPPPTRCGLLLTLYGKYIVGIKMAAGIFYNIIPANSNHRVWVVCIVDRIVGELECFCGQKRNEQSI